MSNNKSVKAVVSDHLSVLLERAQNRAENQKGAARMLAEKAQTPDEGD